MGLFLIAAASESTGVLHVLVGIFEVAVALGMVIFVHELGHFVVAKLCGVKVEKFYLGFDIYGWKIVHFRYGETEYGVGAIPLGGYVKMLGQEDNPARLREEIERAKIAGDGGQVSGGGESGSNEDSQQRLAADGTSAPPDEAELQRAQQALYDPRSYLAKSVPKRMAIISAGVIMNLIFAFFMAAWAYGLGVEQKRCGVGGIIPGEAAWQADLHVGDRIAAIAGKPTERFQDLQESISLGDIDQGVTMVLQRPGVAKPIDVLVHPNRIRLAPTIGITSPSIAALFEIRPDTTAAAARPGFEADDKITKVDGVPIADFAQLHAYLAQHADASVAVTVERPARGKDKKPDPKARPQELTIQVAPQPVRQFGLVMEMGEITAVQDHSPAAAAGLRPGDIIRQIDRHPELVADPMRLPDLLRASAGKTVTVSVERAGAKDLVDVPVTLRPSDRFNPPVDDGNPLEAPALGVTYRVLNRVRRTDDGSPAAKAGLRAGDMIVRAKFLPPEKAPDAFKQFSKEALDLSFDEDHRNWPLFMHMIQLLPAGARVELQWRRGDQTPSATLEPVVAADWFTPDRGFLFAPDDFLRKADSVGEALRLGGKETGNATLLVYRFLRKAGHQVSMKGVGGPGTIAYIAYQAAQAGLARLLLFLTMISANLAVLNFLPIPLLDGGHMVLLAWEGVRGKPADERVQIVLTYIGLFLILLLMFWAIGLEVTKLFKFLFG